MNGIPLQKFKPWLRYHGIELSKEQASCVQLFIHESMEWNQKINLIGLKKEEDIIRDLVLDSLLPCAYFEDTKNLLDIGSGAGFPGILIKIYMPHIFVTLLEPRQKRVSFLKQVIRICGLKHIRIIKESAENFLTEKEKSRYDMVTLRALGKIQEVLALAAPFVRPKGLILFFAGQDLPSTKEYLKSDPSTQLKIHRCVKYILPGKTRARHLLFLEKVF